MRMSKYEYFTKGIYGQKHPDITFTFKRKPDIKKRLEDGDFSKAELVEWLGRVERNFKIFKKQILKDIK